MQTNYLFMTHCISITQKKPSRNKSDNFIPIDDAKFLVLQKIKEVEKLLSDDNIIVDFIP